MGIDQPCKQAIWDDNIVNYISLSFFKQKSPVNCDKYHLCACMIPNWYCESPAALASPVLPLLPRTHLNPSTCALTMQSCHFPKTTKEAFLFLAQTMTWYCTGHLPLQRNKVLSKIKLYWNRLLSRISNTPDEKQKKFPRNGRRIERELAPVPKLFKSKMADQLPWCNNKCIISMQGFVWVISFMKANQAFCYPALLTVDGWFHFFSCKGLGKSQFTSILLTEARICLCNLRMYGHAPLLMGI